MADRQVQIFHTASGIPIYQLPMEAFPGFWVYAYLVFVGDYRVLIDTGSGFGNSNDHLEAGLGAVAGLTGEPAGLDSLTHVLLTHGHIDHFGGLAYVQPRTPAKIGVHELDLRTVTHYEDRLAYVTHRLRRFFVEAGTTPEKQAGLIQLYQFNKHLFHSVPVDFTFEAGGMALGPFTIFHVPGHCAGHVVIRLENILFAGDHVLSRTSPHMAPESLTMTTGLSHYLDSLRAVKAWAAGVSLTLGGHERPILDLPARVDEIIAHHRLRLDKVLALAVENPCTIAEISHALFGEQNGYNALLAIEESGAHIEYLHQRGEIRIANLHELEESLRPVALRYHI